MRLRLAVPLLLLWVDAAGCRSSEEHATADAGPPSPEPPPPQVTHESPKADVEAPQQPPPIAIRPLIKAERKLPFNAKGSTNLGFKIDGLARLHALEGTVEVPPWSPEGSGDPMVVRDDDLSTAWTCTASASERCGIGIHFPQMAKVSSIRLFAAVGPTRREFERNPRPRTVRLHTPDGYTDANFIDTPEFQYAILGRPLETQNISVEILDAWGPDNEALQIAEFEVYGTSGVERPPLDLDPRATYVAYQDSPWSRRGEFYTALESMVYWAKPGETPHPFLPGSAILGRTGDRFLLLEDMASATCSGGHGTYFLLDRQTRVLAPLGELGGPGGDLFRRRDGQGIALGYADEYTSILNGVIFEGDQYVRRRTPIREDKRKSNTFEAWGMQPAPVPRGGLPLRDAPPDCAVPSSEALAALATARGDRRASPETDPEQWRVCNVGDQQLFVTDRGPCGKHWELVLLDAAHALVARHKGRHEQADIRLTQLAPDRWWVEASDAGDTLQVFEIKPGSIAVLASPGALAARPPAACRKSCQPNFPNPHAPKWK